MLINAGAFPDTEDRNGRSPLHEAAHQGFNEVVRALLDGGADVNAMDHGGSTPLHWASCK